MAIFFRDQLDFILFFYGLAFILLGATCFAVGRTLAQTIPWTLLGAFAYVHGAGEWLDLLALIVGDTVGFALTRTALMAVSYVILVEFGRRGAAQYGIWMPGRWVYGPMLVAVVWGWHLAGIGGANALARYAVGLPGTALGCLILAVHAHSAPRPEKRWLIAGAATLALYGFAAGIVVPATADWAGDVINYDLFADFSGIPIQFVRGVLACCLTLSIWAYWERRLIVDVDSERYSQFQRRQFGATLIAMTGILIAGWLLTQGLGDIYKSNVEAEAHGDLNLIASRLAGETAATKGMVKALAGSQVISQLTKDRLDGGTERALDILSLGTQAAGAVEGFILDAQGTALATSARASVSSTARVGQNFSQAAYFKAAMANGPGYEFAVDRTHQVTNYYVSYPIRDGDGRVTGVAVLKKPLARFEADMQAFDRSFAMVDRDGVVVLTNRPEMRLRTLWPLSPGVRSQLSDTYGPLQAKPALAREINGALWTSFDGERDYVQRRALEDGTWTLVTWKIPQGIFASRVLGIIITLQLTIMALMYFVGRERSVHDNVQMERRFALEELARKLDNKAATDPLTGVFNRRKFDRSLDTEIMRARRYKSPLSVVMFDVDHFKTVNDNHGHLAGDTALIDLTRYVASRIRGSDVLARWGGEEFVILCPGSDEFMASKLASNLRADIAELPIGDIGRLTCSFGVAQYNAGDTAETLMTRVDTALYRAKTGGRNRVELALPVIVASPELAPLG